MQVQQEIVKLLLAQCIPAVPTKVKETTDRHRGIRAQVYVEHTPVKVHEFGAALGIALAIEREQAQLIWANAECAIARVIYRWAQKTQWFHADLKNLRSQFVFPFPSG